MNTDRTIHLHLGFHKTGSTSLQELLRVNRGRLGADTLCFVQYDPELRPVEAACKRYDRKPTPGNARALHKAWVRLMDRCARSGAARILISSENLSGRIPSLRDTAPPYAATGAILGILAGASAPARLEATLYLRDGWAWLDSLARHLARTRGETRTARDLAATEKFAHPETLLSEAAARIAAEAGFAVHTLAFEDDLNARLGPGESWLRQTGISDALLAGLEPVSAQNPGLSQAATEALQRPWMRLLPRKLRAAALRRRAGRLRGSR